MPKLNAGFLNESNPKGFDTLKTQPTPQKQRPQTNPRRLRPICFCS